VAATGPRCPGVAATGPPPPPRGPWWGGSNRGSGAGWRRQRGRHGGERLPPPRRSSDRPRHPPGRDCGGRAAGTAGARRAGGDRGGGVAATGSRQPGVAATGTRHPPWGAVMVVGRRRPRGVGRPSPAMVRAGRAVHGDGPCNPISRAPLGRATDPDSMKGHPMARTLRGPGRAGGPARPRRRRR